MSQFFSVEKTKPGRGGGPRGVWQKTRLFTVFFGTLPLGASTKKNQYHVIYSRTSLSTFVNHGSPSDHHCILDCIVDFSWSILNISFRATLYVSVSWVEYKRFHMQKSQLGEIQFISPASVPSDTDNWIGKFFFKEFKIILPFSLHFILFYSPACLGAF